MSMNRPFAAAVCIAAVSYSIGFFHGAHSAVAWPWLLLLAVPAGYSLTIIELAGEKRADESSKR